MSAPKIDVLAVMEADAVAAAARRSNAVQPANVDHDESNAAWHRSLAARAAVAELIERLEASNWRLAEMLALLPAGRPERAQIEHDMANNRATLARIGGAA